MGKMDGILKARERWKKRKEKLEMKREEKKLKAEREKLEKEKIKMKPAEIVIPEAKKLKRGISEKESIGRLAEKIVFHELTEAEIKEKVEKLSSQERIKLGAETRLIEFKIIAEKEAIGATLSEAEKKFKDTASKKERAYIDHLAKIDVIAEMIVLKRNLTAEQEAFFKQMQSNPEDMAHFEIALKRAKQRGY